VRRLVVVGRDLIAATRIGDAAAAAGYAATRVDAPRDLPSARDVALVVVDWSERDPGWGEALRSWRDTATPPPRLVLFGPHTDLAAHAEARRDGLGPMLARSRLYSTLPDLLER
jgi:hypothetical protein